MRIDPTSSSIASAEQSRRPCTMSSTAPFVLMCIVALLVKDTNGAISGAPSAPATSLRRLNPNSMASAELQQRFNEESDYYQGHQRGQKRIRRSNQDVTVGSDLLMMTGDRAGSGEIIRPQVTIELGQQFIWNVATTLLWAKIWRDIVQNLAISKVKSNFSLGVEYYLVRRTYINSIY